MIKKKVLLILFGILTNSYMVWHRVDLNQSALIRANHGELMGMAFNTTSNKLNVFFVGSQYFCCCCIVCFLK